MFVVEDPCNTVHKLFEQVSEFGNLAGCLIINFRKTKTICKNMTNL